MKVLRTITGALQKTELFIGAAVVLEIFILTTMGIVMRYIFNHPLSWCEEVITYSFIWMGFLTVSYTLSKDNHVRFSLILDKLPPRAKAIAMAVMDAMIAAVFVILFPSAVRCIGFLLNTPALKVPEKYFYAIVPIGYSLIVFHSLVNMLSRFFPFREEGEAQADAAPPEKKKGGADR